MTVQEIYRLLWDKQQIIILNEITTLYVGESELTPIKLFNRHIRSIYSTSSADIIYLYVD